ncbi:MAG: amidohydrolase family protein, partial [Longimicrobiales bacterium]
VFPSRQGGATALLSPDGTKVMPWAHRRPHPPPLPGGPQRAAEKRVLFVCLEAGVEPVEILRSATVNAAALQGMEGRIGVLSRGAVADIIAVDGDPVTDFASMQWVSFLVKAGMAYSAPSRD